MWLRPALLWTLLSAYLIASVWTARWFPFVHSDEAWLALLSEEILASRIASAREPFFHLTPRYPHAIKVLFHLLQAPFVAISRTPLSVRLVSVVAGVATILAAARFERRVIGDGSANETTHRPRPLVVPWAALLLALDVQFMYISHLARQEALILAALTVVVTVGTMDTDGRRVPLLLGTFVGLSVGIHPNAFVAGVVGGFLMIAGSGNITQRVTRVVWFALPAAVGASVFVAWSFVMDGQFLQHYLAFGSTVGVTADPLTRWFRFERFFEKAFNQWAGTYYLPPVRFQMVLFGATHAVALVLIAARDRAAPVLRSLVVATLGIALALFLIGKYSPPSMVFFWPTGWLVTVLVVRRLCGRRGFSLLFALVLIVLVGQSTREIARWHDNSYQEYATGIREHVPADARVLANLNTGFIFEPDRLSVYRDLTNLQQPIADQLAAWNVQYILYPEEMDVIYAERPVWNDLYGNVYPYYKELQTFLADNTRLIGTVYAPVYAMRIVSKMDSAQARVRVYKVQ